MGRNTRATNPMTDTDIVDVEAKFDTVPENGQDEYGKFLKEVYTGRNAEEYNEDEDEEFVCKGDSDEDDEEDPEEYIDDADVSKDELAGLMEDLQMVADPRLRKLVKKKAVKTGVEAAAENLDKENKENVTNMAA